MVTMTNSQDSDSKTVSRATSPIIGVVLLVGLTVILSTIVAAAALGMMQDSKPENAQTWAADAPNATFDIERIGDQALIAHTGAEPVAANEIEIRGDIDPDPTGFSGQRVADGDSMTVSLDGQNASVRVVWVSGYGPETLTEAVI